MKKVYILFALLSLSFGMFGQSVTKITKPLSPLFSSTPVVYQDNVAGGYHQVADIAERDGLSSALKEPGMLVWVQSNHTSYQWNGTVWNQVQLVRSWEEGASFFQGELFLYGHNLVLAKTDGVINAGSDPVVDSANWESIGTGTVTSTSIATANGVSGSVANATTSPEITLTLGDITPTSVTATNSLSGAQVISTVTDGMAPFIVSSTTPVDYLNINGNAATVTTNANMTGDVISIGNTTALADKAVTLSKMNDIPTASFIGRNTASTGSPEVLDLATVKTMLGVSENITINTDRVITLSGTNVTGQNLGAGGKTLAEFLEAFFFPAVAGTPPTSSFTTTTTTFPYSTWKNWPSYTKNDISFSWGVTNVSQSDATDDKLITSIKLKSGATELATAVPTGTSQAGTFTGISLQNTNGNITTDFTKTYTLEVVDAQPNTVLKNISLVMSKAVRLTYGVPTLSPTTTAYEYDVANKAINLNWSIVPNDETISSISVDGTVVGSTSTTGTQSVTLKTIANGGTQTKAFPLVVTGNLYGAGTTQNSAAVSWENRLYRGVITSAVIPSDPGFTFTDAQIKTQLLSENKLGGNWKATAGYDFTCGAGGQYVVFAYPNDAVTPVVQYFDSNFGTWMTYPASDLKIIDRNNFVNQLGYSLTNYKLVFVCVQYINATVKIRLQ